MKVFASSQVRDVGGQKHRAVVDTDTAEIVAWVREDSVHMIVEAVNRRLVAHRVL